MPTDLHENKIGRHSIYKLVSLLIIVAGSTRDIQVTKRGSPKVFICWACNGKVEFTWKNVGNCFEKLNIWKSYLWL